MFWLIGRRVTIPPQGRNVVQEELEKLRSIKLLSSHFDYLINSLSLEIVFHNVQSLHCHIRDVQSDQLMLHASVLCFVEGSTLANETYEIPGFRVAIRLDCPNVNRSPKGILIFVRTELFANVNYCCSGRNFDGSHVFEYAVLKYKSIGILVIYKSPIYSLPKFRSEIENLFEETRHILGDNIVILGDFNLCLQALRESKETYSYLLRMGLRSLLDLKTSTTREDTHIDWAFSNMSNGQASAKTFETVHSFHDAISVSVRDSIYR